MGSEQLCTFCCSGTRYGKGKLSLGTEIDPIKQIMLDNNRHGKG